MKIARQGAKALSERNKEQNPTEIASPGKPDSYPTCWCITRKEAATINECDAHKYVVCISVRNESFVPAVVGVGSFTE
jgi:hypothetical protein